MLSDDKYDARLRHTGEVKVLWIGDDQNAQLMRPKVNIPQYVTCTCRLGIELFPFDTQFCAVALASPLLTIDEMEVGMGDGQRPIQFAWTKSPISPSLWEHFLHFLYSFLMPILRPLFNFFLLFKDKFGKRIKVQFHTTKTKQFLWPLIDLIFRLNKRGTMDLLIQINVQK